MGISFKVGKTGTRFRPKPPQSEAFLSEASENSKESSVSIAIKRKNDDDIIELGENFDGFSVSSLCSGEHVIPPEHEVSFTLNLFPNGFSIGKPVEKGKLQPLLQDVPKLLHPYDRTSETLFSAIESGWLPGDILDDIPGKYFRGMLVCEVRDYRKCVSEAGNTGSVVDGSPIVNKVCLRMSLENVVKDIPSISDGSWTYSDLMEVESRIVKALQPQLCLDPTPMMDRLCGTPDTNKLKLAICGGREKRLKQMPEVTVASNNQTHGKKIFIDRIPESANCKPGDIGPTSSNSAVQHLHESTAMQHVISSSNPSKRLKNAVQEASIPPSPLSPQPKFQSGANYPRIIQGRGYGYPTTNSRNPSLASGQDASLHGKRENQDAQLTPTLGIKRQKQIPMGVDSSDHQQHAAGPQSESQYGTDIQWKIPLSQPQSEAKGSQCANIGGQKYPQQLINDTKQAILQGAPNQEAGMPFHLEQQGMKYSIKQELTDTEKFDKQGAEKSKDDQQQMLEAKSNQMDWLPQQTFMSKSHFPPQTQWHYLGQLAEKDMKKDDMLQKRKLVQSPRVSSGPLIQSPISSKSGEISSGSFGAHIGAVAMSNTLGSQKEKVTAIGTLSVTSSANDSLQRQHSASMAQKRRSNSLPKAPAMNAVGSPVSVGNVNIPLNANSPSVGTPTMVEQVILERFSKIEMVALRYKLNSKRNKVDNHPVRKPVTYSTQNISLCLSNALSTEDLKDTISAKPLSNSLVGGNMNICKARVLNFIPTERVFQGNGASMVVPRSRDRLIMSEKPSDGTVAFLHGDTPDESNFFAAEDHLPTLPNTHRADLLAAQFCSLITRDGYQLTDQVRPRPMKNTNSISPATTPSTATDNVAMEPQYPEAISGQPSSSSTPPNSNNTSLNSSIQNVLNNMRILPPDNAQTLHLSQGNLPTAATVAARPQHLDQVSLQQQQNQQPQIPRSSIMHPANQLSNLSTIGQNPNLPMGNYMANSKPSPFQLQLLQQQQQQQQQQEHQQPHMHRKMMMGLGAAMGVGNLGNNIVGLSGLSNVTGGMGGVRGMGSGMSPAAPMGPISGLSNVGQSSMNLTHTSNIMNQLRSGALTQAQAAAMASRLRMVQNRASMLGSTQSGNVQMNPSSASLAMLGQSLNRSNNIGQLSRTAMASMGSPKISGANYYLNQQQQLQLQQQQQIQQIGSPLQNSQAGSPSMAMQQQLSQQQPQHQQVSPPQTSQHHPLSPQQQLISGTLQQMTGGNAGAGSTSPQLSSQNLGSVGSAAHSPMEIQGVNNSNSINNV